MIESSVQISSEVQDVEGIGAPKIISERRSAASEFRKSTRSVDPPHRSSESQLGASMCRIGTPKVNLERRCPGSEFRKSFRSLDAFFRPRKHPREKIFLNPNLFVFLQQSFLSARKSRFSMSGFSTLW